MFAYGRHYQGVLSPVLNQILHWIPRDFLIASGSLLLAQRLYYNRFYSAQVICVPCCFLFLLLATIK